ncbi:ATP-binding protein [Streptomyces sp. p1417]|uniref:ATP-binding protein n=1 Tax=Streptomyces typhae TaxID=2681492 RepID=A0A6L6WPB3_9ACTN|nr:ATP-binding protein [Streptomyces typhae]MVO83507.1 ATP-binding protein [Streptomyces typhae]
MKQSAAKTLGVAALGAAFAATGAGAANAASAVPDVAGTVSTVTSAAPVGELAETLPDGAPESLAAGQSALGSGLTAVQPTLDQMVPLGDDEGGNGGAADRAVQGTKPAPAPAADPVSGLLGGLPVQQVLANNALPTGGLPLKALPTQALPTQGLPTGALGATPLL